MSETNRRPNWLGYAVAALAVSALAFGGAVALIESGAVLKSNPDAGDALNTLARTGAAAFAAATVLYFVGRRRKP